MLQRAMLIVCVGWLCAGCVTNSMLREKAQGASANGDTTRARAYLIKAVNQDPTDWQAVEQLGKLELKDGRPLQAQGYFERAVTLKSRSPETARFLDLLAESLYRQGEHSRLQAMLESANRRYNTSHDLIRQSYYLAQIGDADGSELALRKAFEFSTPGEITPHMAAADFYLAIGREDESILSLRRAYTLQPDNEMIHQRLRDLGVVPGPTIRIDE